ncbi:MAG: hypothetical protein FWF04_04060 [Clostridiales bacterium]|nr:hypothetical protein [Clostridiales bacterium]
MQKKFSMLLVMVLVLTLVFCCGAIALAILPVTGDDDDPPTGDITAVTDDDEGTDEDVADDDTAVTEPVQGFVIPVPEKVVVSNQALAIDGTLVEAAAYNIDGSNYFKLRDLAALLTGSGSQFNVTYEEPNMIVTTGEGYTQIDGDLVKGEDKSDTCVPSRQTLLVNGAQESILVYNIGGNNYFQLRGLGELVGFAVDYDDETRTMLVQTATVDGDTDDDADDDTDTDTDADTDTDDDTDDDLEGIVQ